MYISLQLVCPPLFGTKGGGGQHSNAGEGGEPIRTTGEKPGTLFTLFTLFTLPVSNGQKLNRKFCTGTRFAGFFYVPTV